MERGGIRMASEQNLHINGMGKIRGGKYGNISISGMGTINGPVEAGEVSISGMGSIKGRTKAENFHVNGLGKIKGDLEVRSQGNNGNTKVDGHIKATHLKNNGRLKCTGNIKAEQLNSNGRLVCEGDIDSEIAHIRGSFRIAGLLNIHQVEIEVDGIGYVKEIGGERISVKKHHKSSSSKFIERLARTIRWFRKQPLKVGLIEGTQIYIEHTRAKTVRGNNVMIGPNCRIDLLEYSDTLEAHPECVIKRKVKI
jgi:cytoskeletal protein CcmA (bactofilin family)